MATQIQIRRDTAANWTSADPTLASGELGFETDTNKLKSGDGSTAWTSLDYITSGGGGGGGATVQIVTSLPTSGATAGDLVFHAGLGTAYFYSGTQWIPMGNANETGIQRSAVDTLELSYGSGNESFDTMWAGTESNGWTNYFNTTTNGGSSSNTSFGSWWANYAGAASSSYYTWTERSLLPADALVRAAGSHTIGKSATESFLTSTGAYFSDAAQDATNARVHWASTAQTPSSDTFYGYGGKSLAIAKTETGSSTSSNFYTSGRYTGASLHIPDSTPVTDWEGTSWRITMSYLCLGFPQEEHGLLRMGVYLDSNAYAFPVDYGTSDDAVIPTTTLFMGVSNGWTSINSTGSSIGAPMRAGLFMNASDAWTKTHSRDSALMGMVGLCEELPFFGANGASSGVSDTSYTGWDDAITSPNADGFARAYGMAYQGETIFEWDNTTGVLSVKESFGPNFTPLGSNGLAGDLVTTTSESSQTPQLRAFLKSVTGVPKFHLNVGPFTRSNTTTEDNTLGYSAGPIKIERLS